MGWRLVSCKGISLTTWIVRCKGLSFIAGFRKLFLGYLATLILDLVCSE
jgi:hypothetical protein